MSEYQSLNDTTRKASENTSVTKTDCALPLNRFELELEFVQALASPAYIHFLATLRSETSDCPILQDVSFIEFLKYLRKTWSQPEYSRFLAYPHCLYFLDMLIEKPASLKEWTLPAYRNFCHQQQFLTWQHRHRVCYGRGLMSASNAEKAVEAHVDTSTAIKPSASSSPSNK